jgi:hypothetical protein
VLSYLVLLDDDLPMSAARPTHAAAEGGALVGAMDALAFHRGSF